MMGVGVLVAAYLVGSVPFGLIIGRAVGKLDIRQAGSGNIGATNVGRLLGFRWGLACFGLDLAKGFLPTALFPRWLEVADPTGPHWQVGVGIAAILGHMFPCWLGFRGGKGVATALGVVMCLAPWSSLIALGTFVAVFAVWRYVSLASILAAIAFAVSQLLLFDFALFSPSNWTLGVFSLMVPALIIIRHRDNIRRLLRGEEKRFAFGRGREAGGRGMTNDEAQMSNQ